MAKRQQSIDQLIVKVDAAFGACGYDFRREAEWKDSHSASGCIMFAISYYTALSLYRSAFMGKKSATGAQTLKNLVKVLSSMNSHEWCCRAEHVMEIPVLNEMREFAKKPLASYDDLPEDTLPKDAEQPVPTTPASTLVVVANADAVLESPIGKGAASGHVEAHPLDMELWSMENGATPMELYLDSFFNSSEDADAPRLEVGDGMPVQGDGVVVADTAQEGEACIELDIEKPVAVAAIAEAVAAPAGLQETLQETQDAASSAPPKQPPQVLQANSGAEAGAESGHAIQEMQISARSPDSLAVAVASGVLAPQEQQEQPCTCTPQSPVKRPMDRPEAAEAQAPKKKQLKKEAENVDKPEAPAPKPKKQCKKKVKPNPLARFGATPKNDPARW